MIRLLWCLLICSALSVRGQELADTYAGTHFEDSSMPDIKWLIEKGRQIERIAPDSAWLLYQTAYRISKARKYTYGVSMALMRMARTVALTRERKEALPWYQKALTYALQSDHGKNLMIMLHLNIASIYNHYGDYHKAADHIYAALNLIDETVPERLAVYVYNGAGGLHMRLHQPGKTLYYIEKSETIARHVGNTDLTVFILSNKAHTLASMQRYDEAERYFQEAIALAAGAENPSAKEVCLTGMAEMLLAQGRPQEALQYLEPAIRSDSRDKPAHIRIFQYYHAGRAYLQTHRHNEAIHFLRRSVDTARKYGIRDRMQQVHTTLAAAFGTARQFENAWEQEKIASILKDSLMAQEKVKAIDQLEFKYQSVQKDVAIAKKDLLISNQKSQIARKNLLIAIVSISSLALVITLGLLYRNRQHRQRLQDQKLRDMEQERALLEQEKEIKIMQALISGGEKERTRLARELHDGVGGRLAALQIYFSSEQHTGTLKPEIRTEIINMLEETAEEIRHTAHNLMPDVLTRYSFEEALEMYCVQLAQVAQLHIDLQIHASVDTLPPDGRLSLYRIIQELLKNIVKHSGATNAAIQINRNQDLLTIIIEDNGQGFNPADQRPGLGLQNVENRIRALNGTMTIESSPRHGTIVQLEINLS
jgi:signal transduction histidine kinase